MAKSDSRSDKLNILNLILIGILLSGILSADSYIQRLELREKFDDDAPIIMTLTSHLPNISEYPQLENISYICGTGFWLGYRDPNYEAWAGVAWGGGPELSCAVTGFPSEGSIRHGGSGETDIQMASLYENASWVGPETSVTEDELNPVMAQSIVITGTRSWTIFEDENYEGRQRCLSPDPESQFVYFFSVSYYFNLTGIRSIRKGC